jgi:hypothetical protein
MELHSNVGAQQTISAATLQRDVQLGLRAEGESSDASSKESTDRNILIAEPAALRRT